MPSPDVVAVAIRSFSGILTRTHQAQPIARREWVRSHFAEETDHVEAQRAAVRVPRIDAAGMADAIVEAIFPIRSGASVLCLPTTALARLLQT
jgi:hypothetical protein